VNEPPCAGLTGDERTAARPPAGHERPACRATAVHERAASGRLTGDEAAPAPSHAAASLRESGHGNKRDARQEREGDGPDGWSLDHRDASTARDGRSVRFRRGIVKRASDRG
jgi:hypothetical protein